MLLWQGRKLGERGDHAEARAHLERALAVMTELGRYFDRAQVLDALGDVHAGVDSSAAADYFSQAARIYEGTGHLVAAAAAQLRADEHR